MIDISKGGFFLGGPTGSAVVYKREHIEPVIAALAMATGDDPDEYTATYLDNPTVLGGSILDDR